MLNRLLVSLHWLCYLWCLSLPVILVFDIVSKVIMGGVNFPSLDAWELGIGIPIYILFLYRTMDY
jgi:hypothetical protein